MKTTSYKGLKLATTTITLGILALLPRESAAQTVNDPFTDLADWGAPFTESGKNLSVASGRLNFTSANISGGTAAIPRTMPLLTTTQHWSVQVDAHLDNFTITSAEQSVSLFLGVGKTGDWFDNHVLLGFDRDDHFPDSFGMNDDFMVNGSSVAGLFNLNGIPSGDVAMRLAYDAATKTLTFAYDANGATGGYSWVTLGNANLAAGAYNLHFSPTDTFTILLAGWANLQTVTSGQAYFDNLEINILPQTGSLQATISPTEAVSAGAQWQVDGGAWQNHSNVVSDLSVGEHTVTYKTISGWNTPSSQTVVVTVGATTVTNGIYTPQTGALQVLITPPGAVSAGAQWQVDGGAWQNSGATVSDLAVGNHTVAYKTISGWNTPTNQTVLVAATTTTVTNGAYVQQTGSLLVTIDPAGAVTAGAQWQVDGGAWQNSGAVVGGLAAGNHTVSFKNIPEWITPLSQFVVVALNTTTTANGLYASSGGPLPPLPPTINCSLQGDTFTVSYTTTPGQPNILQYTDDLTPPRTWRPIPFVTSPITFATAGSPACYFRVRVGEPNQPPFYSVNIVGYVRRAIQAGLNLVANPLYSCSDNSIASLFPNCPENSEIRLPAPDGSLVPGSVFSGGAWDVPGLNLWPGQGVGFWNPASAFEVTFAGEVPQGSLTHSLPAGLSLVGSILPVNGLLDFPAQQGDEITTWNATNQTSLPHEYWDGTWQPVTPAIRPAEAFWVQVSQFKQWTQQYEWNDLEVWESPIVTRQPEDLTKALGNTAHFTAQALGGWPLNYQWRKDGTNLLNTERVFGANTYTLAITNAQPSDAGNYSVVITNFYGSVTSSVATLTVQLPPPLIISTNSSFGISNGIFGFTLSGLAGQTVVTEAATNLANPTWLPLETNILTSESLYITDLQWTNFPGRFYRLRSQ